jgi:hypothetical protein
MRCPDRKSFEMRPIPVCGGVRGNLGAGTAAPARVPVAPSPKLAAD